MLRYRATAILLFGVGLAACSASKSNVSVPAKHPEELPKGRPTCSAAACHGRANKGVPYARYDHSASFAESGHRNEASRGEVCAMCHQQSFCIDCHATSCK